MTAVPDIVPADLVRAIEAQYDLRVTAAPQRLPASFHSRAWLVSTTQGRWVVKLSDPRSDPIPKLEQHLQLTTYLNEHAIHAPQFLALCSTSRSTRAADALVVATRSLSSRHGSVW